MPGGLASYPHPWLMPDFWQFPTVSMGLGPIMAIYQARFMRYLTDRGVADTSKRKVWAFLGDGETDEPESLGAIALAGREKLSNLVFVVNCNLQRLDGPVHGNGKIIQELETIFRGAGWNVIKVIWGDRWDPLLEADTDGLLVRRMEEAVDGEYQVYKARDGKFVRDHFFGKYPELARAREGHDRRRDLGAQPRRARLQEGVRGVCSGAGRNPQAHRDPRQDHQGLRDGRGRRGPEHHPPAEEDERGRPARLPGPLRARHRRRGDRGRLLPQAGRGLARAPLPARAPRGARRLPAGAPAQGRRGRSRSRSSTSSPPSSRARATARSRRPWPSSASWPRCCATRRSARVSCRSSPTSRGPSAWRGCSASSGSTPTSASSTSPRTPSSSWSTARTARARCSRRASPRPARSRHGSPQQRPTRTTRSRWSRSSPSTRCSASSGSWTWPGRRATTARAASSSAAPPAGRP